MKSPARRLASWPEYEDDGEEVKVVESGFAFADDTELEDVVEEEEEIVVEDIPATNQRTGDYRIHRRTWRCCQR